MRKSKYKFGRVDRQVTILLTVVLVLSGVAMWIASAWIYEQTMLEGIRNRMVCIYDYIDSALTWENSLHIDDKTDMTGEEYQQMKKELNEVRGVANALYLYTARINEDGQLVYVVDGLSEDNPNFRYPGDLIEEEFTEMFDPAFEGELVLPEEIMNTEWGHNAVGIFPLHDDAGNVVCVFGITVNADQEAAGIANVTKVMAYVTVMAVLISAFVSLITFRRISNPKSKDLANTDFLTKLRNRNAYETDSDNRTNSGRCRGTTVLMIDMNYLKQVNDKLGHDVGDQCLQDVGQALQEVESVHVTPYRFGGDEFVVLADDTEDVEVLAHQIKEIFESYNQVEEIPVSLSIGYAQFDPQVDRHIRDTQKRADRRMYEEKQRIHNCNI